MNAFDLKNDFVMTMTMLMLYAFENIVENGELSLYKKMRHIPQCFQR